MSQPDGKLLTSSPQGAVNILVTGATGFLGGWVMRRLCKEFGSEKVIGTGRNEARAAEMIGLGYTMVTGDLADSGFVRNGFPQITHVVHCAARSSPWGSYSGFYRDNVLTTRNLLTEISGIKRFIYISTPSIYFDYRNRLNVREDAELPRKFVNHYTATKYLAEMEVLNFHNPGMIRLVIRPRAIIGAGDTVLLPRVIRAYNSGRLRIIGNGMNTGDFSSAKNIAHAVYLAIISDSAIDGKIFNITDDEPQQIWPLLEKTLEKLGFHANLKRMNYSLVFTLAALSEIFSRFISRKEPVLTRYGTGVLFYSLTLDISAAKKFLKYKPIINTEKTIEEFVNYYKHGIWPDSD